MEIANADDVVDMHDDPATVVKKKKDSSMVVGLTMLKEGGGDAFVSAGSTGALLSAATLIVRRVKGIRRAAMGPQISDEDRPGARPHRLRCERRTARRNFCCSLPSWARITRRRCSGIEIPRVALLNIGAEDSKGGAAAEGRLSAAASRRARQGMINFIGNIEARDVPLGGADVVVSDGFSGNVLLKGIEGTAHVHGRHDEGHVQEEHLLTKLAALLCMDGHQGIQKENGLPRDGRHRR